jgi:hypothetical protein
VARASASSTTNSTQRRSNQRLGLPAGETAYASQLVARTVYKRLQRTRKHVVSHSYFEETPTRNAAVKTFFRGALNGEVAERNCRYDVSRNLHAV